MEQKNIQKKSDRRKKLIVGSAVTAGILAGAYFGMAIYFCFHFLPGTKINGMDCSMKTAEGFQRELEKSVEDYTLTVTAPGALVQPGVCGENEGNTGTAEGGQCGEKAGYSRAISGREIDLELTSEDQAQSILEKQGVLAWPSAFFRETEKEAVFSVAYNELKLEQRIRELDLIPSGSTEAVSAHPVFDGETFVIQPEVYGVQSDKAEKKIRQCIADLTPELDLMEEQCLQIPDFSSDSPEVEKACEAMNQYCKARIVYTMGQEVTVDAELISGWLTCDGDMNVSLNEEAVGEWVNSLAEQSDTLGTARSITSPSGKNAEVSGGTYGWVIDTAAETAALTENIKKAESVSREPVYRQRAASRSAQDWGVTYVEVDLTAQHMWYVKDGSVQLESDVVTGEPVTGMETPQGVYSILYTQRDAVLIGETDPKTGEPIYRTKVRYWMPFTQQGHGFHDADWQSAFGGNVYTYSGSHGCVNMPVDKAGELYSMLETGTPVVIHY